jgi:hypothetical protein
MTIAEVSPLEAAIAELGDDATVAAITTRIRGVEPDAGDALGAGSYQAFVVLTVIDAPYIGHTGIRDATIGIRAYAATWPDAEALYQACEAVFRDRPARKVSGVGVYHSQVVSGGIPDRDPDTQQPLYRGVIAYPTTTAAV